MAARQQAWWRSAALGGGGVRQDAVHPRGAPGRSAHHAVRGISDIEAAAKHRYRHGGAAEAGAAAAIMIVRAL